MPGTPSGIVAVGVVLNMLKELMFPAEVKLLKPNPAGCWHCVPAMMHGLLSLCGPRVFPCIGPVSVSETAEALCGTAKLKIPNAAAKTFVFILIARLLSHRY